MQIAETFISINGEGRRAGEPAVFLRFKGCNLSCSYCDTGWANRKDTPFKECSPEELAQYVQETGITNVTITGGEPLLQNPEEMKRLLELLLNDGTHRVEIETNGSVDLRPYCGEYRPVFTMDWKLPSSGCEEQMLPGNLELMSRQDTVKFVSGSREDLERGRQLIQQYRLTERCAVYFSPVFGRIDPEEIVSYLLENRMNDVRLQLQLHKFIWDPDKRGV